MTALSRPFARLDRDTQDKIAGAVVLGFAGAGLVAFAVVYLAALAIGVLRIVQWVGGL